MGDRDFRGRGDRNFQRDNGFGQRDTGGEQGFPSEEDRVNCPFYFKIGACRNGDRCNRLHNRPATSSVLLLEHLYPATAETMLVSADEDWDDDTYARAQEHMEIFFEEVFLELAAYGEIEDLVVCDNCSEHMLGNVYVKYTKEEAAAAAMEGLVKRFYGSKLITAEYSPVTDFREARCRAFHETRCSRGGLCNFMHIKHCPKACKRRVAKAMYEAHPEYAPTPAGGKTNAEARSRSPKEKKEGETKRMSPEERKAMIAKWNKDRFAAILQPGAPAPPPLFIPPPPAVRLG